jgi:hypothetical protein
MNVAENVRTHQADERERERTKQRKKKHNDTPHHTSITQRPPTSEVSCEGEATQRCTEVMLQLLKSRVHRRAQQRRSGTAERSGRFTRDSSSRALSSPLQRSRVNGPCVLLVAESRERGW